MVVAGQNFVGLSLCVLAVLGYADADLSGTVHHHHRHHHRHHHHHHGDDAKKHDKDDDAKKGVDTATGGAVDPQDVETQAKNAREAASSAKQAASVAKQVAEHSIDITSHAQAALKHAKKALHGARVDTSGLSADQKESLRKAEEKLKAATQTADYGALKNAKYTEGMNGTVQSDARMRSKLGKLQDKLDQSEGAEDVSSLRSELRSLRETLAAKRLEETKSDKTQVVDTMGTETTEDDITAEQMEQQLRDLEEMVKRKEKTGWKQVAGEPTKDEVKSEMERLRIGIARLKGQEPQSQEDLAYQQKRERLKRLEDLEKIRKLEAQTTDPEQRKMLHSQRVALEKELGISSDTSDADIIIEINQLRKQFGEEPYGTEYGTLTKSLGKKSKGASAIDSRGDDEEKDYDLDDMPMKSVSDDDKGSQTLDRDNMVKMGKGSFDIDTEMPYGELEPFGREDTAQELTESSINESDQMVDQLERAEVAEEKRAVFRALTRLRGAAITSFDGVARSQTGNIDEYNKTHKWRKTHPLHHLADEESDISKWAFPDNADF